MKELLKEVQEIFPEAELNEEQDRIDFEYQGNSFYIYVYDWGICLCTSFIHSVEFVRSKDKDKIISVLKAISACKNN